MIQGFDLSLIFAKSKLNEKCRNLIAAREFKDLLIQKENLMDITEFSFFQLLDYHNKFVDKSIAERSGFDKSEVEFLSSKDIENLIRDFCNKNYPDKTKREEKISKFIRRFVLANNEKKSSENSDENFFASRIQALEQNSTILEKQNELLQRDNKKMKELLTKINHQHQEEIDMITSKIFQHEDRLSQILQENHDLRAQINILLNNDNTNISPTRSPKEKEKLNPSSIIKKEQLITPIIILKPSEHKEAPTVKNNIIKELLTISNKLNSPIRFSSINPKKEGPLGEDKLVDKIIFEPGNYTSNLLGNDEIKCLHEWLPKKSVRCQLNLIYKGSRDGYKAKNFHEKCDNRQPTISVIKSNFGLVFGGYIETTWNCINSGKEDNGAFIFSLTYKEKFPCIKAHQKNAIGSYINSLVNFGNYDIKILENCDVLSNSSCSFPTRYSSSKFTVRNDESMKYLAGGFYFMVSEIEVFEVNWD